MEVFDTSTTYEVDATDIKYKCKVLTHDEYKEHDFDKCLPKE